MCYILCLAVSDRSSNIDESFDDMVCLDPLGQEPLARAATAGSPQARVFALTVNGCSCDVLVGGHRMDGRPELVTEGLARLLKEVPEVILVKHWFTRPIDEVDVQCVEHRVLKLREFKKLYPKLDDDVRYIIRRD